jgi:hypothetical protein
VPEIFDSVKQCTQFHFLRIVMTLWVNIWCEKKDIKHHLHDIQNMTNIISIAKVDREDLTKDKNITTLDVNNYEIIC